MPIPSWFAYSIRDGSLSAPLKASMILPMNCHRVGGGDIVCPADLVTTLGTSSCCLSTTISLLVLPVDAGSRVSASLPRVVLKSARATNRTTARVFVFRCLRKAYRADTSVGTPWQLEGGVDIAEALSLISITVFSYLYRFRGWYIPVERR
jgi:hypothetical protein